MLPFKTLITLDRTSSQALYQQLAHELIKLINKGVLNAGVKLPSSRIMSEILSVHRKTIVSGYEELILQGWLETIPQKGTYVNNSLPKLKSISPKEHVSHYNDKAGFQFNKEIGSDILNAQLNTIHINDGIPDVRLAPTKQIGQLFKEASNTMTLKPHLGYESPLGTLKLRQTLTTYLSNTRGIKFGTEHILTTRGSQMGIYLSAKALINLGDNIIVGETNYNSADLTFESFGAILKRVRVDEYGIVTDDIEVLCKMHKIKAVYVTSHHHHPTTVTLSADRRLHLLNLAQHYNFAIIEDDYDYDFHYKRAPILPLAAYDTHGNVIYIGSFCKTVAPGYRIGYLIASKDFVKSCSNYRRSIDRQGDLILEYAFSYFIERGELTKHINKVMKIYEERRSYFCEQLIRLDSYIKFVYPTGGMAVWVTLKPPFSWAKLSLISNKFGLQLGDWKRYDYENTGHESIRIGFANFTRDEITEFVNRLEQLFKNQKGMLMDS